VFGIASVAAAFPTSAQMLIASRALLGVAGAAVMPSVLALVTGMFTDQRQRSRALAIYLTCFMGGLTLGPLVGGLLLEYFWWGSVFLVAVPGMVLLLVSGPFLLPGRRAARAGKLDPVSVVLCLAAILPFVYRLKELVRSGWQWLPAVALAFGIAVHEALAAVVDGDRRAWHLAAAAAAPDESIAIELERAAENARERGAPAVAIPAYEQAARLSPGRTERARRMTLAAQSAITAGQIEQAAALVSTRLAASPSRRPTGRAVLMTALPHCHEAVQGHREVPKHLPACGLRLNVVHSSPPTICSRLVTRRREMAPVPVPPARSSSGWFATERLGRSLSLAGIGTRR
jgi:hypothetical protein